MCLIKEKHKKDCARLRTYKFSLIEHKNEVLRQYCKKYLTRDVLKALLIKLDGDNNDPSLELAILRGLQKTWVIDEFVDIGNGLIPKWYLENKSVPCMNIK